ncbi:unnamed protein product [Danaus chrysippus]|uniref:(African queen) hypothetical protein n=1 Tax=Danaus chrysippus TaxID=151541 RepID=A0A8J2W0N2_9NEOP|nr:unnamed protein product [Danaus chrysippus]
MGVGVFPVALLCAMLCAGAAPYTVDCNHEYTDCDNELSKLTSEDDDSPAILSSVASPILEVTTISTSTLTPTRSTPTIEEIATENITSELTTTEANEIKEALKPKPRLLNLNVDELQNFANALHNQSMGTKKVLGDLSDVNLDGDDDDEPRITSNDAKNKQISDKFYTNLQAPFNPLLAVDRSEEIETCKENEVMYKVGEHIDRACEETCVCTPGGHFECSPRCKHPYIRRGRRLDDPLCFESPVDICCSIVTCATGNRESKPNSVEICKYGNNSHPVGSTWNIGCEQTCACEPNSIVTCKPRCKNLPHSEKCINVQDPKDECCEVQVCDVSQDVHEEHDNMTSSTTSTTEIPKELHDLINSHLPTIRPLVLAEPIGSIKVLQNNSVQVNLMHMNNSEDPIHLLLSSDGGKTYSDIELVYSNLILNLDGGKDYILKTKETGTKFNFTITALDDGNEVPVEERFNETKIGCYHEGQFYAVGEEFKIHCAEVCECTGDETRECAPMICPSHVGLELVSRSCVEWEPSPPPQPPNCCPRTARCLSDGTCHYKGHFVPNWSEVPLSVSGCEQRCFCENGIVDCQEACNPLPSLPPQSLRCPPMHRPAPVNISDEDCCKQWGCVPHGQNPKGSPTSFLPTIPPDNHYPQDDEIPDYDQNNIHRPEYPIQFGSSGLPIGFPVPQGFDNENKKLSVLSIQSDSPTSIKMLFGLASVLVGLRGSVDLRYTDTANEDITQWQSQVFAPADEILTTPRLEFRLTGLKPSTTYKIRGKLYLHNLKMEPESEIYTVRTQDLTPVLPLEEKRREIDAKLTVLDVNDTTAQVSWRHFTEDELQLIDGIQVRYRPTGTPIYSMTELLHHSRSHAELRELRPGSKYEASLVLIPPPRSTTELIDPGIVEFTTAPFIDPYNWSIVIESRVIGSEAVELTWRGVPEPAERWVRVYRAAHACGEVGKEHDALKLAARDSPNTITLSGLDPDSRCRVWLELFLTNGKVKTSNVLDIHTKSMDSPEPIDNVVEASTILVAGRHKGDYYGALVVVGVLAALGALATTLLLLVLVRRHRPRSVPITSPRESSLPPYDNPAYKLELQQETMDVDTRYYPYPIVVT